MQITKCDICKKEIEKNSNHISIWLEGESWGRFELCGKCGKPVADLLKSKKLVKVAKK